MSKKKLLKETSIERNQFMMELPRETVVKVSCNGCCNIMSFHREDGAIYEIESVVENGTPSMKFTKWVKS